MIKKYLPSRPVLAFIVIPFLGILLFFLGKYILKQSNIGTDYSNLKKQILEDSKKETDTDGDGLLDWEEKLIGSDINKQDTDGDGFNDGFEIKVGSNPLDPLNIKSEEKRAVEEMKNKNREYDYRFDDKLNTTEKLSAQFLEEGLKLQRDGMAFNKDAQAKIINNIISQNTIKLNLNKYSKDSFKIGNFYDKDKFKNDVIRILDEVDSQDITEESYLLNQFLATQEQKWLDEIKDNTRVYKKALGKLEKINVPSEYGDVFVNYMNAYNLWIQEIEHFSNADVDPVAVVQMLAVYKDIDTNFYDSLTRLGKELNKE